MNLFPIAADAQEAIQPDRPTARTEHEAAQRAGGPVYLALHELEGSYPTIAAAEEAVGGLYGDPRFELVWKEDGWRVVVRFWRPAPAAPVGRTVNVAAWKPLGFAGTPDEAQAILGAPAERVSEQLGPAYATRARAMFQSKGRPLVESGLAQVVERAGKFVVCLAYWRPIAQRLSPAERAELAARTSAPLRSEQPQQTPYIGLFEKLAPENPAIVLAEEGDGRARGE